jgi:hypothetical protein
LTESAHFLGVHRLDVDVSLDVIGVRRGHQLCELPLEEWSAMRDLIFVNWNRVVYFLKVPFEKRVKLTFFLKVDSLKCVVA